MTKNQREAVIHMYRQNNRNNNKNTRKNNFDVKAVQALMKQDLIDVGDAIVSKIFFEDYGDSEKETEETSDSKSTKKHVKSCGIGNFLSKRTKRE